MLMKVKSIIERLSLTSKDVPVNCIIHAKNPISFIEKIISMEGDTLVFSVELRNDLYLIRNELLKEQQKEKGFVEKAVWKLWEQLKIEKEKAENIVSRCNKKGFTFVTPFHILYKDGCGYHLLKKESFPLRKFF